MRGLEKLLTIVKNRQSMMSRSFQLLLLVAASALSLTGQQVSFTEKIYPILERAGCRNCHNVEGVASATRLHFPDEDAAKARVDAFGKSLAEREMADKAREILAKASERGSDVALPLDGVVAAALQPGVTAETVAIDAVPDDQMILDVGPKTVADLTHRLSHCRTLVWNGPLGAFETSPFEAGTVALAKAAAAFTDAGKLLSVAGGGDTVAALAQAGVLNRLSYVSTAGGAFLEWLEGKTLPGVAALSR